MNISIALSPHIVHAYVCVCVCTHIIASLLPTARLQLGTVARPKTAHDDR